jgi:hypothetical protein
MADFDFDDFDAMMTGAAKGGCLMFLAVVVLNLLFWGGLIWLIFFLLGQYGVIG